MLSTLWFDFLTRIIEKKTRIKDHLDEWSLAHETSKEMCSPWYNEKKEKGMASYKKLSHENKRRLIDNNNTNNNNEQLKTSERSKDLKTAL